MTLTFAQLQALTDTELVERYNGAAIHAEGGLAFWRDELMRRDLSRANQRLDQMTSRIVWMTAAILALTLANAALVAASIWH